MPWDGWDPPDDAVFCEHCYDWKGIPLAECDDQCECRCHRLDDDRFRNQEQEERELGEFTML